jgi:hypothetical protein
MINWSDTQIRLTLEKAEKIRQFLEDAQISEVLEKVRTEYLRMLVESDPKDSGTRESLYQRIRALDDFRRELASAVDAAEAARIVAEARKLRPNEGGVA